ncbi:hypothetical protein [Sulfurimonas sp.]
MIEEYILNYVLLFVFLEFYEVSWQKAPSIMGMLVRMHKYYEKNVLLFLIMHPTFYFSIGFVMLCEYNTYAVILFLIKTIDIATKIQLIEQIFVKKELSKELTLALLAPINNFLPYIGIAIYPVLIVLALG